MSVVAGPRDRKFECVNIALFIFMLTLLLCGLGLLTSIYWADTATLKTMLEALGVASIVTSWWLARTLKSRLTRL
jgi:hypothetical protein